MQVRRAMSSCALSPCVNNATCLDIVEPPYYRCVCPPSSGDDHQLPLGADCEPLSPCDSMPCPEQATCVVADYPRTYRCVCDADDCAQPAGALTSLRHHPGICGMELRYSGTTIQYNIFISDNKVHSYTTTREKQTDGNK